MRRGRNNTFEDEGQVGANSSTAYLYQDEQEFVDGRYEVGGGEIDQEINGDGDGDGYVYDEDDNAVHNAVGTLWGGAGGGGGPSTFTVNVPRAMPPTQTSWRSTKTPNQLDRRHHPRAIVARWGRWHRRQPRPSVRRPKRPRRSSVDSLRMPRCCHRRGWDRLPA